MTSWPPQADEERIKRNMELREQLKTRPDSMKPSDRVRAEQLVARDERKRVKREKAKAKAARKTRWLAKKGTGRLTKRAQAEGAVRLK